MEYNYEKQRINAFIIVNNKLYEKDQHFECIIEALKEILGTEEIENNYEKYFQIEDSELKELLNSNIITGEISKINNAKSLLCYCINDLDIIQNYYNVDSIYHYSKGILKLI